MGLFLSLGQIKTIKIMQKYLFLILDRYEASFSTKFEIKSNLDPRLVFRNCMIEKAGMGAEDAEEIYNGEIADEVCMRGDFITYDGEEESFLLIKLGK